MKRYWLAIAIQLGITGILSGEEPAHAPTAAEIERLVDQLVFSDNDDTYPERGQRFLKPAASQRINRASGELFKLEKAAWEVLLRHLDDARPSLPRRETNCPYTVGLYCHVLLSEEVVSYPGGYPDSKTCPAAKLGRLFQPSLKAWLLERRTKPLDEIRLETLDYVIALERAGPEAAARQEIIARLASHREELRQRVVRESNAAK